jgi:hypothetical protein
MRVEVVMEVPVLQRQFGECEGFGWVGCVIGREET